MVLEGVPAFLASPRIGAFCFSRCNATPTRTDTIAGSWLVLTLSEIVVIEGAVFASLRVLGLIVPSFYAYLE